MQHNSTAETHTLGSTGNLHLLARQPLSQLGHTEAARFSAGRSFVCPPAAGQQELMQTEAQSLLVSHVPHLTILNR